MEYTMTEVTDNAATPEKNVQESLKPDDHQKIDKVLDDLDVSTTSSGEDQTAKPDTEGSNSSSKNLDEQNEGGDPGSSHDPV
jgi:hypothetical protein